MGAQRGGGLLEALEDRTPEDLLDDAKELDKGYIAARHPNAHPRGSPSEVYTKTEAERAIGHAEAILGFCESLLGARPR